MKIVNEKKMSASANIEKLYNDTTEGFVGVRDVARFLGRSPNFVYEQSHPSLPKPLPALRKGKYLYFKISEVERWLKETSEKI